MKKRRDPSPRGLVTSHMKDAGTEKEDDWQGRILSQLRVLIKQADPAAVEERKWRKPSNPE